VEGVTGKRRRARTGEENYGTCGGAADEVDGGLGVEVG